VRSVEVAALVERDIQQPLQAGRGVRDDLLGVAQLLGIRQRGQRGVDLLGGVGGLFGGTRGRS
jgi:hypothetical protein